MIDPYKIPTSPHVAAAFKLTQKHAEAARKFLLDDGLSHQADPRHLAEQQIAATLAAGMIAASGTAHTAEEAVAVWREVMGALVAC